MVEAPKIKKSGKHQSAHSIKKSDDLSPKRSRQKVSKLFDVFPESRIQSPCNDGEEAQENQNPHTNADARVLSGSAIHCM